MTNDVFNDEAAGSNGPGTQEQGDKPTFDFIGEGKQYVSVEKALESIPFKDEHIARLEREAAEMREKFAESKSIEDILNALKQGTNQAQQGEPSGSQGGETNPSDIKELVKGVLQEERSLSEAKRNVKDVTDFMVEHYGDKAKDIAIGKAEKLGITLDDLKSLAVRSPAAYKALFQHKQEVDPSPNASQSDVNPQSRYAPVADGKAKFDEIRKKDLRTFLSSDVQVQMMKEAMADPEKFFG